MFGVIASLCMIAGFATTAFFFVNPLKSSGKLTGVVGFAVDLVLGAIASVFLGVGTLFVFMWSGVYV